MAQLGQDPLSRALDDAIRGQREPLDALLTRGSHLPGTRMNAALADAFAHACRGRGTAADPVAFALAHLTPDEAPGASAREFLPVCGVLALAARAAGDTRMRRRVLVELHARADDPRFRVRDAVVEGLSRIGQAAGDALVAEVASWMDGYFHAAAVLRALSRDAWLGAVHEGTGPVARLAEAFRLHADAPRAAARWPGHKELVAALGEAPVEFALRVGVPVFDLIAEHAASQDPGVRAIIERILDAPRLAGRFGNEVARVRRALDASRAPPRNPDHDVGPTRDRSHRARRRR